MGAIDRTDTSFLPIVDELLTSIDPAPRTREAISISDGTINLKGLGVQGWDRSATLHIPNGTVSIIAVGKAAPSMLKGATSALRGRGVEIGRSFLCLSPYDVPIDQKVQGCEYIAGTHPIPGLRDIENATLIKERFQMSGPSEPLLFLLSGGSSALTFMPVEGLRPEDKVELIRTLFLAGADIEELNTVRRTLSGTKGGGLLGRSEGKGLVTLAISDVMSDDPRFVGSGLTYPWKADGKRTIELLRKYGVEGGIISRVIEALSKVDDGRGPNIPSDASERPKNVLIMNNTTAVNGMKEVLGMFGKAVHTASRRYSGLARSVAPELLTEARVLTLGTNFDTFIMGGEATVDVKGKGRGGRCSEMALSVLPLLECGETVACLATDGVDGSWGGGGAVASKSDIGKDVVDAYLSSNDSGTFFERFGGTIKTGPTKNNVGDLFIYFKGPLKGPPRRNRRTG